MISSLSIFKSLSRYSLVLRSKTLMVRHAQICTEASNVLIMALMRDKQVESPSNTRDDSEIEGKERAHKGGAENVGLQTKSSLGLDFRTTGWFIYKGDSPYPN